MRIRLTEWATRQGISYGAAFRWGKEGKIPGLVRAPTGRLFVEIVPEAGKNIALYGRVSSADQASDLERQMDRLRSFAAARGFKVSKEVKEIGSGLNGHRKKLVGLLHDADIGVIIVEYRDRLARFGTEYIEASLASQGRTILIMNDGDHKLDMVQDFIDVVTSMCARIYGQRAGANRAKAAIAAAKVDS